MTFTPSTTSTPSTTLTSSGLPPAITTDYSVDAQTRASFERNGFVKLRQVVDPEVLLGWAPVISDTVVELNTQHLPLAERDSYGKAFLQVSNIWEHSAEVARFVFSADLARIAAELLNVGSVRLYHDQALYKEAAGGITPWHADQYYWPFASDRCVTVWVPLQDTPEEMGPLCFAAGSQGFSSGRDLPISDASENQLQAALDAQDFAVDRSSYALGDLSFHLGWTFHRAGVNSSTSPRRVMTMIYMDAEMVVAPPTNDNQVTDLGQWLPGCAPGDVAASRLNPILYAP